MGNVKLGNTGDEPAAPAQYPHIEGKRKKKKIKKGKQHGSHFLFLHLGKSPRVSYCPHIIYHSMWYPPSFKTVRLTQLPISVLYAT